MSKKKYQTGLERFNRIHNSTNVIFNIVFIILAIVAILPVLFVVSISLTSEKAINDYGYSLFPRVFSGEAYHYLLNQSDMLLRALGVSLFVTIVGTIIGVILTSTMGYVLSRSNFKLRGFLTWVVFIPMVFSGGLVSSYFINTTLLGLSDSIWALILPLSVSSFNVIICKTFFKSTIPDSLIESAKIDGASQLHIYFKIIIPISLPVLATIGLFLCFGYWNDWFQSMLYINDQNKYSLQALLNVLMNNIDYLAKNADKMGMTATELIAKMPKESARMAIAVVIVIPIACAYPYFQKYFISGLTIGAVKG